MSSSRAIVLSFARASAESTVRICVMRAFLLVPGSRRDKGSKGIPPVYVAIVTFFAREKKSDVKC